MTTRSIDHSAPGPKSASSRGWPKAWKFFTAIAHFVGRHRVHPSDVDVRNFEDRMFRDIGLDRRTVAPDTIGHSTELRYRLWTYRPTNNRLEACHLQGLPGDPVSGSGRTILQRSVRGVQPITSLFGRDIRA